jgi:hypothetical protein
MNKCLLVYFLLVFGASLFAARSFEMIYGMDAPTEAGDLGFITRLEGDGVFYASVDGEIQELELAEWIPGWKMGSLGTQGYLGFRSWDEALINPVFSSSVPELADFTDLVDDPAGDHLFPTASLDILAGRISFTEERLYFAMKVASGTYPVSSGFTYYAYMPVIVEPFSDPQDDPTVYGLMYTVEVGSLIGPGLYKISGSGFDGLSRLGDIEFSVQGQWLILSCSIADLLADADFAAWYDPDYPLCATSLTTSRITLVNGIQQADMTDGVNVLLKAHHLQDQNEFAPQISNIAADYWQGQVQVSLDYQDMDANVPRFVRFSFDDDPGLTELWPQDPQTLDFTQLVSYQSPVVSRPEAWQKIIIEISDGDEILEFYLENPVSNQDDLQIPSPQIRVYPNPASDELVISSPKHIHTPILIFNLKGQKVKSIPVSGTEIRISLDDLASGLYFVKIEAYPTKRILVMPR